MSATCHMAGFAGRTLASIDYRTLFEKQELLSGDGISLTKEGWNGFANELAKIVRRTLN